jgi:hypothetical protein
VAQRDICKLVLASTPVTLSGRFVWYTAITALYFYESELKIGVARRPLIGMKKPLAAE